MAIIGGWCLILPRVEEVALCRFACPYWYASMSHFLQNFVGHDGSCGIVLSRLMSRWLERAANSGQLLPSCLLSQKGARHCLTSSWLCNSECTSLHPSHNKCAIATPASIWKRLSSGVLSPFVAFMMKNSKTGPEAIKRSKMELDTSSVVKPLKKHPNLGLWLGMPLFEMI